MTPLVHDHTTLSCRCYRRRTYRDGSASGLRTTGQGRRLGGRVGRRAAVPKQFPMRRQLALLWSCVAVTDPTWCGHVWPGGGSQR